MSPLPLKNCSMGPLRAVLLDVGHALLDMDAEAVVRTLGAEGVSVSPGAFRAAELAARREVDRRLTAEPGILELDAAHVRARLVLASLGVNDAALQRQALGALQLLHESHGLYAIVPPGTQEALQALKQRGLKLAVVSNAEGNIGALLARTGLAGHFDVILDSAVVGVAKPDPRIFALALESLQVTASEAVHVGDLYSRDVLGARGAGIAAILVDEDLAHFAPQDVPRIRSVAELPRFLAESGR